MLDIILFGPFIHPIYILPFMLIFGTSLQVYCPGYNIWDNVYEFESSGRDATHLNIITGNIHSLYTKYCNLFHILS